MSLFIETNHLCEAAGGDWIFEAYDEHHQSSEEFLLACIALILKQPDAKPRLIKFMQVMASKLACQEYDAARVARTEPAPAVHAAEKSANPKEGESDAN